MKKLVIVFAIVAFAMPLGVLGAVNVKSSGIKKAAPVATQKADKMESVSSLVPTVIGLVGSVKSLRASQEQLTADCVPTTSELEFVNDLVKEWAKIGDVKADTAVSGLGKYCGTNTSYASWMESEYLEDTDAKCYETFSSSTDSNMIWGGFPRASAAKICADPVDKTDCKDVSNIYDVFAKIPFTDEDYTESEAQKIAQFKAKEQKCAPGKIKAAQRELYGNFVTQTLNNVGQGSGVSGTGAVLEAVSSMGGSGNIQSMLPSLGTMATQMFEK